jgi:hypothetical protein
MSSTNGYAARSSGVLVLAGAGIPCAAVGAKMDPPISGRAVAFMLRGRLRARPDLFIAIADLAGADVARRVQSAIPNGKVGA